MKYFFLFLSVSLLFSCTKKEVIKEKTSVNPYYDSAFEHREKQQSDSAFIYFNKAKDLFSQQKDSFGMGKCLINMAIILTDKGDYFGGQETSLEAVKFFDNRNIEHHYYLATNYNNLGIATYHLKDFPNALKFYDQAIKLSDDSLDTRVYLNNKATLYLELKNYDDALTIYRRILKESSRDQKEFARVLSNIAKTKWLQNPSYNPQPEFARALAIRVKENDLWGRNASYAHLADYYTVGQPDSALYYAHKMYAVATMLNSAADKLEALQKLIKLSPPRDTKGYFQTYQNLADSVELSRNTAKNQFALIRYETEKSKADNLVLRTENSERKYRIARQNVILFGLSVLLISSVIIGTLWYKKRKQKLALEAQNAIRESQLKTSKKVHDIVANGLYRVMSEIENQKDLSKDLLLDKIEELYDKSRDISYEDSSAVEKNFEERVNEMLKSFSAGDRRLSIVGNEVALWERVNLKKKAEILHVLQELMVNMKKHSGARNVVVRFEEVGNQINIFYADDGIGIVGELKFKNGLTSTGNRIDSIGGSITFDTKTIRGLNIHISFPVN